VKATLIGAGEALAEVLARENASLAAMDLAGAAALYPRKNAAAAAFILAQERSGARPAAGLDADQQRLARDLAERLRTLTAQNRLLLERAIRVQGHVLGTVARAVARAVPRAQPPRYGAHGALAQAARQAPVLLSSRA
jgi:hypothetical protein